jgi:uncharacterized protein YdiU (UPF0061 family)
LINACYVDISETRSALASKISLAHACNLSLRYVPREWLLARAYTAAEAGDCQPLNEAMEVFERPFERHPDNVVDERFSRLTPRDMLFKAGVAYFS